MDQVDNADQVITENLEKAIAAARGIRSESRKTKQSRKKCVMCNDNIPVKRRKAILGCQRCVSCEEDHERYGKRNKKNVRIEHDPLDDLIDDIYLANP